VKKRWEDATCDAVPAL